MMKRKQIIFFLKFSFVIGVLIFSAGCLNESDNSIESEDNNEEILLNENIDVLCEQLKDSEAIVTEQTEKNLIIKFNTQDRYIYDKNVNFSVVLINCDSVSHEVPLDLILVNLPVIPSPTDGGDLVFNDSQNITVPAEGSILLDYTLTKDDYLNPGFFGLTAWSDISYNMTGFWIDSLDYVLEIPEQVKYDDPFTIKLTITNPLNEPQGNIDISELFPYYTTILDNQSTTDISLSSFESRTFTWEVSLRDYRLNIFRFLISINDEPYKEITSYIYVLQEPSIYITIDSPERVLLKNQFDISAEILNYGDYTLENVVATLSISSNLSTEEPLTKYVGTISNRSTMTANWTISANGVGWQGIDVNASGTYTIPPSEKKSVYGFGVDLVGVASGEDYGIDLLIDGQGEGTTTMVSSDTTSEKNLILGDLVEYDIKIKNTGIHEDSIKLEMYLSSPDFTLKLLDNGNVIDDFPKIFQILPGEEKNLIVRVESKSGETDKSGKVTLIIRSLNDPTKADTGTLKVIPK